MTTKGKIPWRIYYADGSTFSADDGGPEDAPGLGVIAVVQWDASERDRREVTEGGGIRVIDWYWWEGGVWLGGDLTGVVQYLAAPGWKKILCGRNVRTEDYLAVMRRARLDQLDR